MVDTISSARLRVMVLFGGRSAEHEVSIQSARNVIAAMDQERYEIFPVAIDRDGRWFLLNANLSDLPHVAERPIPSLGQEVFLSGPHAELWSLQSGTVINQIDVAFPVLHGPYGEDGTIQGILKYCNIPFVGPSVLGSALGMDKEAAKYVLSAHHIPVARFVCIHQSTQSAFSFAQISGELGCPLFVKPANMGSSVGVHKVENETEFTAALQDAFLYDHKVLVEEAIVGRELECSVLGNEQPEASVVGEIIPQHEFYSYDAKYLDDNGALLKIPAELDPGTHEHIRALACRVFAALQCEGMARVDFFLTADQRAIVNEINTIPGFTKISMYPKMWEASGLKYPELIHRLIGLALARFAREKNQRSQR